MIKAEILYYSIEMKSAYEALSCEEDYYGSGSLSSLLISQALKIFQNLKFIKTERRIMNEPPKFKAPSIVTS